MIEIAFLFLSFQRLRLEREQIRQILLDLEQLTSDTSFTRVSHYEFHRTRANQADITGLGTIDL